MAGTHPEPNGSPDSMGDSQEIELVSLGPMASPIAPATPTPAAPAAAPKLRILRRVLVVLGIALILAVAYVMYAGSHIDSHEYTIAELERGPVDQIVAWSNGRTAVEASRRLDLLPDHVWRVITDESRLAEFMPYVRRAELELRADDSGREKETLELPNGTYPLELEIHRFHSNNRRMVKWRQLKGDPVFNEGAWVVEGRGRPCVLRYQIAAQLVGVPEWASNWALRQRADRLLVAVELRTRDLEQREPAYFNTPAKK